MVSKAFLIRAVPLYQVSDASDSSRRPVWGGIHELLARHHPISIDIRRAQAQPHAGWNLIFLQNVVIIRIKAEKD